MTEYSLKKLKTLVGQMPSGSVPAAWWITTDPAQLKAYDQWRSDYTDARKKAVRLAKSLGLSADHIYATSWFKTTEVTGFLPTREMQLWPGHPDHRPTPEGWRVDSKMNRLVPKRKTKADRESKANKDFAAIRKVPCVHAYLTGLPSEIYLDDRDFGGTSYRTQYRRGDQCVFAVSGADPDRSPRTNEIDTSIWHRQKLSALIALREEATAK
ncbi:hypothetical protein [Mycobacteroides abscessus]|uniref:hypothetical protein n=1 Tax=Mycobacteroides abscessus TaxID=36809 RepID=UPI00092BDB50|nr:hypothetical protein [Mycobacteroides abscessus]SIJ54574.1 Uncharacterised protein [Mycobacteroides abscessus subsp. abscessus]